MVVASLARFVCSNREACLRIFFKDRMIVPNLRAKIGRMAETSFLPCFKSTFYVEGHPACMDPHVLAVLLGATRTSHETCYGCRSPQAPQLAASAIVTEPFHRPFLSRFYNRKIPIKI